MAQRFQISEDDLSTLEQTLPQVANALVPSLDNAMRTSLRRVQKILSEVRWNYGPPSDIEIIPTEGDQAS